MQRTPVTLLDTYVVSLTNGAAEFPSPSVMVESVVGSAPFGLYASLSDGRVALIGVSANGALGLTRADVPEFVSVRDYGPEFAGSYHSRWANHFVRSNENMLTLTVATKNVLMTDGTTSVYRFTT